MTQRRLSDFLNEEDQSGLSIFEDLDGPELPTLPFPVLSPLPSTPSSSYFYESQLSTIEMSTYTSPPRQRRETSSLHTPPVRSFSSDMGISYQIKSEDEDTSHNAPKLPTEEEIVNLSEYDENSQSNNSILASPLFYLSLTPYPGPYNFTVSFPKPNHSGVKPKWCYSHETEKLYAAKFVTFPINIKMETFPADASLILCPIYSHSSARTLPVNRCYLCQSKDSNIEAKNNVIQVAGSSPTYSCKDNRYMVSIPLPQPAPGDSYTQIFAKMACNTSCVGGPNRRPFSILVTLVLQQMEVGRQVIHTKCCEGPIRDMAKDEADMKSKVPKMNVKMEQDVKDMESVKRIASEIKSNIKKTKRIKKDNVSLQVKNSNEAFVPEEYMRVPVRFQKQVKHYVNFLYMREQSKKYNVPFKKIYPSESDTD